MFTIQNVSSSAIRTVVLYKKYIHKNINFFYTRFFFEKIEEKIVFYIFTYFYLFYRIIFLVAVSIMKHIVQHIYMIKIEKNFFSE